MKKKYIIFGSIATGFLTGILAIRHMKKSIKNKKINEYLEDEYSDECPESDCCCDQYCNGYCDECTIFKNYQINKKSHK